MIRSCIALALLSASLACMPQTLPLNEVHPDEQDDADADLTTIGPGDIDELPRVDGWLVLPPLKDLGDVTRVGLMLELAEGARVPAIEVRGQQRSGDETMWLPLEVTFHEDTLAVARVDLGVPVTGVELRLPDEDAAALAGLQYTAIVPASNDEDADDSFELRAPSTTEQGLSASLSGIGVKTRAAWGARPAVCSTSEPSKYRMAVHHTASAATTSSGYAARLRQLQAFHIDVRGWCDIAYHFFVTLDGTLWEARPVDVRGGHVRNNNTGNIGIVFVGCFQPGACNGIPSPQQPTDEMISSGGRLIAALSQMFGIARDSEHVKGHRQHSGATTSCPGDNLLARIGELRSGSVAPPPSCFDDVGGHWAESAICELDQLGLTSGCGDGGSFCPEDEVTRAQMAVFLDRLYRLEHGANAPAAATPFVDIAGHWAETSIERVYGLGLTYGVDDTHFAPEDVVTRAQMAAFLARFYRLIEGVDAPVVDTPFTDIAGHWAETSVQRIYGLGITRGVSATLYAPENVVTRAQIAAFLVRTHNVVAP